MELVTFRVYKCPECGIIIRTRADLFEPCTGKQTVAPTCSRHGEMERQEDEQLPSLHQEKPVSGRQLERMLNEKDRFRDSA